METDIPPNAKQTVVVIGGGAAGVHFIQHLRNFAGDRVNLILIDSKEYFELPINTQRLWVLPQKSQFLTVDYADALDGFGTFIRDSVTSVTKKNKVITASGRKIFFDYCVVATGGKYLNHPWLAARLPHRHDKYADESSWAAADEVESDLPKDIDRQFKAFNELSGFEFDFYTFNSFMNSHGSVFTLPYIRHCVLLTSSFHMETDIPPNAKQTVVVIGGGAAGVHFIQHLRNFAGDRVNLILIDSKEYFELPINTQRLWVLPQKSQFLTVDYADALDGFGTFIRDSVTSVTKKNKVITASGRKIFFDYCVVATGGKYLNHPWLAARLPHRHDKYADESSWAAADEVESDLPKDIDRQFKAFNELSGFEFDFYTFNSFMNSHGVLVKLFLLLRGIGQKISSSDLIETFEDIITAPEETLKRALGEKIYESFVALRSVEALAVAGDLQAKLVKKVSKRIKLLGTKLAYRGLLREDSAASGVTTRRARRLAWEAEAASVAAAKRIIIVGAGVVGVETAADILARFPDKEVSLIHSGYQLMENVKSSRARRNAFEWLVKRGAKIYFDDTIMAWRSAGSRYAVQLQSGDMLEAEKIIVCTGYTYNSDFMKPHFAGSLSPAGEIQVDKNLRVINTPGRMFAIGDVADSGMTKSCTAAFFQAEFLAKSIGNFFTKATPFDTFEVPKVEPLIVELGPSKGMLLLNTVCLVVNGNVPEYKARTEKKLMREVHQTDGMERNWLKAPTMIAVEAS
eukprot:TRINITY_DN488_c0_g1_i1.p1 TRINITY_DN488_c0_g1~~TRINITY_DN488_c0_g1_i1.p1  ORF type:complete len:770 (-),score=139.21 TRINITY_DN488_c0_g1_i1:60-2291(-)